MKDEIIYLDSHATTPVDQDVLNTMLPYFNKYYGNGNHMMGWKVTAAVETARFQTANLIGAKPSEITFTSGSTEAINIALLGLAKANISDRNHIVTQKTEHKAVLECVQVLKKKGYSITMLDVDDVGRINLKELEKTVTLKTLVVSIMLVNNEIGTIQPIKEIGEITQKQGAKFFCDITQGIGWYPLDIKKMNIDLACISSHKIYGPKGVGALFIKKSKTQISPIIVGGGQENGMRPGTINAPAIVGFGKACEILSNSSIEVFEHVKRMRNRLLNLLTSSIEGIQINGCVQNRHPANINMMIPNVSGEELIGMLPNILFSTQSACSSGSSKPSHVLSAITDDVKRIKNSFRLGISKYTTEGEIDFVAEHIIQISNNKTIN